MTLQQEYSWNSMSLIVEWTSGPWSIYLLPRDQNACRRFPLQIKPKRLLQRLVPANWLGRSIRSDKPPLVWLHISLRLVRRLCISVGCNGTSNLVKFFSQMFQNTGVSFPLRQFIKIDHILVTLLCSLEIFNGPVPQFECIEYPCDYQVVLNDIVRMKATLSMNMLAAVVEIPPEYLL